MLFCLQVDLDLNLQYFLRSEELVKLHNKYDLDYEGVMKSSALDAVKVNVMLGNRSFLYLQNLTLTYKTLP